MNVLVLGAGFFGTALAQHLAKSGHKVCLHTIEKNVYEGVKKGFHPNFPEERLHPHVEACDAYSSHQKIFWDSAEVIIVALPVQVLRSALTPLKIYIQEKKTTISVSKGLEAKTCLLPGDIIQEVWGWEPAILSGPSFAKEVFYGQPTAVTLAGKDLQEKQKIQQLFQSSTFRVYASKDPRGLELAGALKNVLAIGCGIAMGMGYGKNAHAALITRGLREIRLMGEAWGCESKTFSGLAGLGDMILTCSSTESRNYRLGWALGQGQSLAQTLQNLNSVAEGYATAPQMQLLAKRLSVKVPILETIYEILYENLDPQEAASRLLLLPHRDEDL